ncbi:MAG: TlpA family protein disulfide reductase [Dysgonamonadaceae bacterium]|jgi:thiol-disulfide isomerase/thioredoxin|nr:TlpA family protein disulfide reductase [Dysgonamonadaceae bacterium]
MKRIYFMALVMLGLASFAVQAQVQTGTRTETQKQTQAEKDDDPSTWSQERIERAKAVLASRVTYEMTPEESAIAKQQMESTGQIDMEKVRQGIAGPKTGDPSPALNAEDIHGKTVTLGNFRGKYVLIDVWATWCAPCRAEIPSLKALEAKFTDKDIAFVSISVDENKEKWQKMVKDDQMTGTQLWVGHKSQFADDYMIKSIPRFILLDKEGKILNGNILRRPSGQDLPPTLEALLDGKINEDTAKVYLKNGFPRESLVGKPSPAFRYPDINDRLITLEDFRGKYVLIDLWATWCGFCIKEIPHLKTIEEKMQGRNIAFVSISVDADKNKWQKMVRDQQLSGVQLYAGEDKSFTAPFDVNGIPRFILLDKEGKVIDPQMSIRPSNPDIYPLLERLEGL